MTTISKNYRTKLKKRLLESAEVKKQVAIRCLDSILQASQIIVDAFEAGGKILICGNGGSAADSQHMAGEFVGTLTKGLQRPGLPAISLTTDTSILTAIGNDMNFKEIFKRQILAIGKKADVLICISTSGNSSNVLRGVKAAKTLGLHTIALTGEAGELKKIVDIAICVPSTSTQYIQESHVAIVHGICELVENHLFVSKLA